MGSSPVLCSLAGHLTLMMPLPTQECKCVPVKLSEKPDEMLGGYTCTCNGLASHQGGVALLPVASYKKPGQAPVVMGHWACKT